MLPIHQVLGALTAALRAAPNTVLVAPPGAGKTTIVPLTLLGEPWAQSGRLIVLEPRRLAARAAARRMAHSLDEAVGATVGYRVRMESRVSSATRIEVVTEGVFTRMILDDPTLEGVGGVVFDEFHERSLDADLGLAFALDAQRLLRPDLRLLVMSATLDGAAVARLLGEATPVIESVGRSFAIQTRYLGRDPATRVEDEVTRAVRRALVEETGNVLVFLPGRAEIARVDAQLREQVKDPSVRIAPLYGGLDFADQDAAVAPAAAGERKIVLATSIAQTSLTIEGVGVVIDSGLARVPRYDPASGLTRLATVRVSRAAADQRRGRAGRTGPGVCWRLWDEAQTRALASFDAPEMLESDLAGVALALAQWGSRSSDGLAFLDPPPPAAFSEARRLLHGLRALDTAGELTAHGRRMATLGVAPRLAHMILEGAQRGAASRAANLAAVLTEPGLSDGEVDVSIRVDRLTHDPSPRGREARGLAARWATAAKPSAQPLATDAPATDGLMLAFAYPERIARARGAPGEFRLANGRGAWLAPTDALARAPWLAIGELAGAGPRDRILAAAALDEDEVLRAFADRIAERVEAQIDDQGRARLRRMRRLDAIVIDSIVLERPEPSLIAAALVDHVRRRGVDTLAWGEAASSLRARVAHLRAAEPDAWPDLSEAALLTDLDAWFAPLVESRTSLETLTPAMLEAGLRARLTWDQQRRIEIEAPARFVTPAGGNCPIDYGAEGGPRVDVRVQELFGLGAHPTIGARRTPLTLALLSPARRPVQITRDLPGFWAGSWREVRIDMKARYPRHPWPEDPLQAPPTTRAKPRET